MSHPASSSSNLSESSAVAGGISPALAPAGDSRPHALFEHMQEGYAYCRMLFVDERPDDFIYLHVNRAFGELTQLTDVVGRKVSEVIPGIQESTPQLFEACGRVARTGRPERMDFFFAGLNIWFSISAFCPAPGDFVAIFDDITERKRSDEALRLARGQLSELLEYSPAVIYVQKLEGGKILPQMISENITRLMGFTVAETLSYEWWFDRLHPEDRVRAVESVSETISRGTTSSEYRLRHKDGHDCWIEDNRRAIYDAAGKAIELIGVWTDITSRKRSDETLRLQSAALTAAANAIQLTDRNGTIVWVNPAFSTLTGYTLAEAVGKNPRDLVKSGAQQQAVYEGLWDTILTGRVWHGELTNRRKDGTLYPEEQTITPLRDEAGRITHFIAVKQDLTERRQAEHALRQSEERYRLFFENNPLPMWIYDPKTWRLLGVNEAAAQHYGYTREEFLVLTLDRLHPAEDIAALRDYLAKSDNHETRTSERRHVRKDGSVIHVEVVSRPLAFESGIVRLVLASDITEKKLLEEKFLHAQRLESLGMLAAGIAHDLNNVLAPIVFAAPLLRNSLTEARDLKILNTLEFSAERGAGLVKQILSFAHSTTGEHRPTQTKHLLRDITSMVQETFPKCIRLQQEIPPDLWLVPGNPTQIHQVLLNLCVNARDAMPRGGTLNITAANRRLDVAACSTIPGARPGTWQVIEVADTGTGIPPEVLKRIWEPFFTTKGPGKGTGLGLSTVRGIVAQHQGFIELQTAADRGTTFRVFLPALETEAAPPVYTPSAIPLVGHGELILVADDDPAILDIVNGILRSHGFRVLSCADGMEALNAFDRQPDEIALVVTDIDMPRVGGEALIRALLKVKPDLRVVAMSGLPEAESAPAAIPAAGKLAHAFLMKPFKAEDLLRALHQALEPDQKPRPPKPSLLLIDDDDSLRTGLARALTEQGFRVTQARDGAEGMKLFRAEPTDLVVTDIVMPNKEGTATVSDLRHEFPSVGIIAMSGGLGTKTSLYLEIATTLGADRTLEKPFALSALVKLIEEVQANRTREIAEAAVN